MTLCLDVNVAHWSLVGNSFTHMDYLLCQLLFGATFTKYSLNNGILLIGYPILEEIASIRDN